MQGLTMSAYIGPCLALESSILSSSRKLDCVLFYQTQLCLLLDCISCVFGIGHTITTFLNFRRQSPTLRNKVYS